jgi:tetratricopeptide (TPR) repeat protein
MLHFHCDPGQRGAFLRHDKDKRRVTMAAATVLAVLMMAQGPVQADVGFEELVDGRNQAAIEAIQANEALEEADPGRLINLGIAYARQGREAEALAMFRAAERSKIRYDVETAEGRWVDSRYLARKAQAMLEKGEFTGNSRMTMR